MPLYGRGFFDKVTQANHGRLVLTLPIFLACGVIIYFSLPFEPDIFWSLATPVAVVLSMIVKKTVIQNNRYAATVGLAVVVIIVGFNAAQLQTLMINQPMLKDTIGPASLSGHLVRTDMTPDGLRLTLSNPHMGYHILPDLIRVHADGLLIHQAPPSGAEIGMQAQLVPFNDALFPNGYDFRRAFFFQGIGATGWTHSPITVLNPTPHHSLAETIALFFETIRNHLTLKTFSVLSHDTAAITAALLNGQQGGISEPTMTAMRISGLAHILSISGLHVSMMGLLVYWPLRALFAFFPIIALRFPIKKWAAILAIISTIGYTFLVGSQAPTLRSALSTTFIMAAILIDRRTQSMRLVMTVAAIVILLDPAGILGPSFQMSFAAVLAMVAYYEKDIDKTLGQGNGLTLGAWSSFLSRHAGAIVMTSLLATFATLPFTLYHFQSVSFYGVIANMVAVPLTSFWIMPSLLLVYLTAPFNGEVFFLQCAAWGVDQLQNIARLVSRWPYAQLNTSTMPLSALFLMTGGFLWLCLWRTQIRLWGIIPWGIGLVLSCLPNTPLLVVDGNLKAWAVRVNDQHYLLSTTDHHDFIRQQWLQHLGHPTFTSYKNIIATDDASDDTPSIDPLDPQDEPLITHDRLGLVLHTPEAIIAIARKPEAVLDDCSHADIVISPFRVPSSCKAAIAIDSSLLSSSGTIALYGHRDHWFLEKARHYENNRPWSPHYSPITVSHRE